VCGFLLAGVSKILAYTFSLSSLSIFASVSSWLDFILAGAEGITFVSCVRPSSGICVSEVFAWPGSVGASPTVVVVLDCGSIVSLNDVGVVRKGFEVRVACLFCCWRFACLLFRSMLIFSAIKACSLDCFSLVSSMILSNLSMFSWWWNLWFTDLVPGKSFAWPSG